MIGTTVTWRFDDEDEDRTMWIAGFNDGEPGEGRISYNSPIGRGLIGATPGDLRTIRIGGQERSLEVINLGPTPASERS